MRLSHGLLAALTLAGASHVSSVQAQTAYALTTNNTVLVFDVSTPGTLDDTITITGLTAGHVLEGLDQRPATGDFVMLARDSVSNQGQIYTLNIETGAATFVAAMTQIVDQNPETPPIILDNGEISIDFNPVPDRLRAVSLDGQNLRINVANGFTFVDGDYAFAVGDPNEGDFPATVGVAYTNDVNPAPAGTVLFALDALNDIHTVVNPPNDGVVNSGGALGVDISTPVGFAIQTLAGVNTAYAAFGGNLYDIDIGAGTLADPGTGVATLIGAISGSPSIISLEVTVGPDPGPGPGPGIPARAVPTASTWALLLLALGVIGMMMWHNRRQSV